MFRGVLEYFAAVFYSKVVDVLHLTIVFIHINNAVVLIVMFVIIVINIIPVIVVFFSRLVTISMGHNLIYLLIIY